MNRAITLPVRPRSSGVPDFNSGWAGKDERLPVTRALDRRDPIVQKEYLPLASMSPIDRTRIDLSS